MASAPVPMKGAEQADDALDKAEASLSDPYPVSRSSLNAPF